MENHVRLLRYYICYACIYLIRVEFGLWGFYALMLAVLPMFPVLGLHSIPLNVVATKSAELAFASVIVFLIVALAGYILPFQPVHEWLSNFLDVGMEFPYYD